MGLGTYLGRPLGRPERSWNLLGAFGLPGGSLGEPCGDPFWPVDPSRGDPEGLGEPILRHLGRVSFWTLFWDPKNHQKSSRTLTIELSPARGLNFHIFARFLSEP